MKIASDLLDEIVAHAQENPRIECCGIVAVEPAPDGTVKTAIRVYPTENVHASALKFEIDPMEQYRVTTEIEEKGWEIGAIYHSHVRSEPKPSQTDISFAAKAGPIEWIIVGLAAGEQPLVLSYLIDGPDVQEVALEVGDEPGDRQHAGAGEAPS
jgi:[CysO sulfur-carrier protein]-S-L-cysteine hydrolase